MQLFAFMVQGKLRYYVSVMHIRSPFDIISFTFDRTGVIYHSLFGVGTSVSVFYVYTLYVCIYVAGLVPVYAGVYALQFSSACYRT